MLSAEVTEIFPLVTETSVSPASSTIDERLAFVSSDTAAISALLAVIKGSSFHFIAEMSALRTYIWATSPHYHTIYIIQPNGKICNSKSVVYIQLLVGVLGVGDKLEEMS